MSITSYTSSHAIYLKDTAITANVPAGGSGTWSIAPALPAGLSINSSNGHITGTPTTITTNSQVHTVTSTGGGTYILQIGVSDTGSAIMAGSFMSNVTGGNFSYRGSVMSGDGLRMAVLERDRTRTRVYSWNGSGWTQVGSDFIDGIAGQEAGDASIALSKNGKVFVRGVNCGNFNAAGSTVKIYTENGGVWTEKQSWVGGTGEGNLGSNVAISDDGNRICIVDRDNPHYDYNSPPYPESSSKLGTCTVYETSNNWTTKIQVGTPILGIRFSWNSEQSGYHATSTLNAFGRYAVELSGDGNTIACGHPQWAWCRYLNTGYHNDQLNYGKVFVYKLNNGVWEANTEIGQDGDDDLANYPPGYHSAWQLGVTMSLSYDGTSLALGSKDSIAVDGNTYLGSSYVFSLVGANWVLKGGKISNMADGHGNSNHTWVSLSSDGNRLAVGVPMNSNTYTSGILAANAGSIQIYDWYNNSWVKLAHSIYGMQTASAAANVEGGGFGWVVSLSSDGRRVASTNGKGARAFDLSLSPAAAALAAALAALHALTSGTSIPDSVGTSANTTIDNVASNASNLVASGAAVTALVGYSGHAEFSNANVTATKKRNIFKSLMKKTASKLTSGRFVFSNKVEFLKFVISADGSTTWQSNLKDDIEVINPGASVNINFETHSVYSPFGDGESVTITDASCTPTNVFVMSQSGSTFSLTRNGVSISMPSQDTTGKVFQYVDNSNLKEYTFIWGSGTASGNGTSGADGDPYVTTLGGVTYKMDDFTGFSRILQGTLDNKLFTINAESNLLTKDEITDLIIMRNKQNNAPLPQHLQFDTFPAYFTKLYVAWGDDHMIIDLKNHNITESTMNTEYETYECEDKEYRWSDKRSEAERMLIPFGDATLVIKKFKNMDLRNGFNILGSHHITNRSGALEHTIYTKDMKLKKLTTLTPLKQVTDRRPKRMSKETFYEKSGEERIVELPIF